MRRLASTMNNHVYQSGSEQPNSSSELQVPSRESTLPVHSTYINHAPTFTAGTPVTPMSSPFMVAKYPIPILPSAGLAIPAIPANNTVPEFLYQLTKMLTGGHKDIIEWSNGKIEVHNPLKLQDVVLKKYFRHSKFASFQRQLNYFGFRKIAGKGKMAPCSYINEAVTSDIGSLLLIKRKTSTTGSCRDNKNGPKAEDKSSISRSAIKMSGNGRAKSLDVGLPPQQRSTGSAVGVNSSNSQNQLPTARTTSAPYQNSVDNNATSASFEIAKCVVGKGVRHGYTGSAVVPVMNTQGQATSAADMNSFTFPPNVEDSLSQLTDNFQNTLNEFKEEGSNQDINVGIDLKILTKSTPSMEFIPGLLSRNSSLTELAMIPTMDDCEQTETSSGTSIGLHFVDFPNEETNPSIRDN